MPKRSEGCLTRGCVEPEMIAEDHEKSAKRRRETEHPAILPHRVLPPRAAGTGAASPAGRATAAVTLSTDSERADSEHE